jgi:hypothetical protein
VTQTEKRLRDDYETVSAGLVDVLDVLDQVYGLLRLEQHGEALAVVAEARQRMASRTQA